LCRVGAELAKTRFLSGTGRLPQLVEHRPSFRVELLDGQDRDIAMLGVDPRACLSGQARCREG